MTYIKPLNTYVYCSNRAQVRISEVNEDSLEDDSEKEPNF